MSDFTADRDLREEIEEAFYQAWEHNGGEKYVAVPAGLWEGLRDSGELQALQDQEAQWERRRQEEKGKGK